MQVMEYIYIPHIIQDIIFFPTCVNIINLDTSVFVLNSRLANDKNFKLGMTSSQNAKI